MAAPIRRSVSGRWRVASTCASTKGSVSGSTSSVRLLDRLPLTIHTPSQRARAGRARRSTACDRGAAAEAVGAPPALGLHGVPARGRRGLSHCGGRRHSERPWHSRLPPCERRFVDPLVWLRRTAGERSPSAGLDVAGRPLGQALHRLVELRLAAAVLGFPALAVMVAQLAARELRRQHLDGRLLAARSSSRTCRSRCRRRRARWAAACAWRSLRGLLIFSSVMALSITGHTR